MASSKALAEARECMLLGGSLDLFREAGVQRHMPGCSFSGCPAASEKVFGSCVAPELPGEAREIALTLHAPCSNCAEDGGVELAGHLWMALAAVLQVPLQEMQVSVLLMRDVLWNSYPLQHFTLQKGLQGPLVTPHGGVLFNPAVNLGKRWDVFIAVRIHTARIDPGNGKYLELLALHPSPILEATGWSDGVDVFEIAQHKTSKVELMTGLSSAFKIRGLPWGQEPPTDIGGGSDPRVPGSAAYTHTTGRPSSRPTVDTSTSSTTRMPESTSRAPAPAGCPCRSAWLGDGFCDDICNSEVCGWDRGDCGSSGASTSSPSEAEVKWPNGYYSPSTSEWESWPVGLEGGTFPGNRGPIIDMNADGEILHVRADREDGQSWPADQIEKDYAESEGLSQLALAGLSVFACCVPIVCCFARRRPRKERDEEESGQVRSKWAFGHGFDESLEDEERGSPGKRDATKFSPRTWNSQFSEETTDTGGSSPSGSWGLGSKEPKVHPEPVDPEECRPSRGDWRNGRPHSAAQASSGPWGAQETWHVPTQPNTWYHKQESERQRRQREKEEQQKSQRDQTKADQEAWQQDWIKKKREQEKVEKDRKRQEEETRKQQQKEFVQKQQDEAERQRKRQEEEVWKKKEEELRRRAQQEAEAERAERQKREDQRKQQEKQQEREAQQRKETQQRKEAQRREAQRRKEKKEASSSQSTGGFFGRWGRSRSEPPKETTHGQHRRGQSADTGHQWTPWPGAKMSAEESREEKARKAKETAERLAKEKQQEAAEKKASSLMDRVMKQIDSTRDAPLEERKKVFKDLQRQLHPDKNPHDQEAAKLAFQKLMENRNIYLA